MNLSSLFKSLAKYSVNRYRGSLQNKNRVATGKTNAAIRSESNANGFTVYAPEHVNALEDGRSPSKSSGSGGGFFEQIIEWCRARGIDEGAAFPIYRKINQEGFEGTPGVLSDPTEDIIKNTKFSLAKEAKAEILNSIKATKRKYYFVFYVL